MAISDKIPAGVKRLAHFGMALLFSAGFCWIALSGAARGTVAPIDVPLAVIAGSLSGLILKDIWQNYVMPYLGESELRSTVFLGIVTSFVTNTIPVERIPAVLFLGVIGIIWVDFLLELREDEPQTSEVNSTDMPIDG